MEDTKTRSSVSKVYILATQVGTITRMYSRKSVGLYSIFINRKDFFVFQRRTETFQVMNKPILCHIETDQKIGCLWAYESIW